MHYLEGADSNVGSWGEVVKSTANAAGLLQCCFCHASSRGNQGKWMGGPDSLDSK